ncbi:MAG TPA: DUF1499 domain-containing protein [Thermoanaerobaculia bacterium]|nr:DUF1499 domain-containing protein [Thermoanaerobaculia bacterium]
MSGGLLTLLVLAALAAAYSAYLAWLAAQSRRPRTRGLKDGRLRPCRLATNCVCSQPGCGGRAVEPLPFAGEAEAAMERLAAAVAALPRSRVVQRVGGYLHAELRSRFFGFVDDLEGQVDPEAKVVHLRSGSRIGISDRGVNRRRVEALRARWAAAGGGDSAVLPQPPH